MVITIYYLEIGSVRDWKCIISMVKSIERNMVCRLYGGGLYLGESIMGGSTEGA